jgi:3',5'-cyclic AMP phosphodiesterase CpdA
MKGSYFAFSLLLTFSGILFVRNVHAQEEIISKKDTITFMHLTDPHVCNLEGYHPFFVERRKQFANNCKPFVDFISSVPQKYKSDFLVITGDNVDYYEAQTEKNGVLDTQIEQYSRLLESSLVPVYLTLGNHDIASYFVSKDLAYTNNQLHAASARAAWMRNVSSFRNGTYYSHLFRIDTTIFRFIFLDNAYYGTKEYRDDALPFLIDPAQLLWFDAQLRALPYDVEIVFMHMPLAKSEEKQKDAEPLSAYSSKGRFYNIFTVLGRNPSIRMFFVGHEHENLISNYILPNRTRLTQVMTAAFGYDPANWRVVKLTKEKILVYQPGGLNVEYSIDIRGIKK